MKPSAKPRLHIAFNSSIAGSLSQALQSLGHDERAISLPDDLSFGPIAIPNVQARADWVGDVVGCEWLDTAEDAEIFWREAIADGHTPVAWVCLDDAAEYCGFLEFLWRIGDRPFAVVNATGVELTDRLHRKWMPRSLGIVSADNMIQAGLIDRAAPLAPDAIVGYRQLWGRLRTENASLRVVTPTGLASAPITHFDPWLTRHATPEWQKGARIVGEAMSEIWQTAASPHVSDLWLWGRVQTLAEQGVLEVDVVGEEMRKTRVRLAALPPG